MALNPSNYVTPEFLNFQISTITYQLVLICHHIPDSTIDLCEETFSHGSVCHELPQDQNLHDKWVHGMIYKFVSLQQTLLIPLLTPFSIACIMRWACRQSMALPPTCHCHSLRWLQLSLQGIYAMWLSLKQQQNFYRCTVSLRVAISLWARVRCGGRTFRMLPFQLQQ